MVFTLLIHPVIQSRQRCHFSSLRLFIRSFDRLDSARLDRTD